MENLLMTRLTYLGSAFLFAGLTGCSTMSGPTHKEDSCMVGYAVKSDLQQFFNFKAEVPETYSLACSEGRTAAQTTFMGQDEKGNLHPRAALFALEYNKNLQEHIKISAEKNDERSSKFYKDVNYFFGFYLNKIGGQTIEKIKEYVDQLNVTLSTPPPKPAPRCGAGVIRSCPADPVPAAQ